MIKPSKVTSKDIEDAKEHFQLQANMSLIRKYEESNRISKKKRAQSTPHDDFMRIPFKPLTKG